MSLLRPSLRRVAQRVLQQHESGFLEAQQNFSAAAVPDPVGLVLAPVSPDPVSMCAMPSIQLSQHAACKGALKAPQHKVPPGRRAAITAWPANDPVQKPCDATCCRAQHR